MKNQSDPNQDQIIQKNFPKEIAFKRVQKEIQLLKSLNKNFYKISIANSPIGLKILVETLRAALQNFCDGNLIGGMQMVLFEILLEAKFPFVYPKIFCRTSFCKPSIADGRDILIDIIKKTWTPSILLHEIITLFPIFMKETLAKAKDMNYLQKIGIYHLGCLYNLEDFLLMDSVDVFPVNELMPNNKTIPRYLVLSQSNLLNFEIIDKKNNQMKLISWANLQSLLNIKRKKDEQFTLILTWKDAHKSEGLTQIVALEEASKFCELIIRNMKTFGVKISKNIIKQPDLTLDEVTVKAYEQIDIMDLLENITILESRLPEEFTIEIVNTLMMLYQKAVEYYSALNDPAYDDYLEKLHLLLSREDVQILLRSKAEVKSTKSDKPKPKESKKAVESEEEEEKKEGTAGTKIGDYFPKQQPPPKVQGRPKEESKDEEEEEKEGGQRNEIIKEQVVKKNEEKNIVNLEKKPKLAVTNEELVNLGESQSQPAIHNSPITKTNVNNPQTNEQVPKNEGAELTENTKDFIDSNTATQLIQEINNNLDLLQPNPSENP